MVEEDIDWWSKYYASVGDYDKSGDYIERGYDKIIVRPSVLLLVLPRVVVLTFVFEIKLVVSLVRCHDNDLLWFQDLLRQKLVVKCNC